MVPYVAESIGRCGVKASSSVRRYSCRGRGCGEAGRCGANCGGRRTSSRQWTANARISIPIPPLTAPSAPPTTLAAHLPVRMSSNKKSSLTGYLPDIIMAAAAVRPQRVHMSTVSLQIPSTTTPRNCTNDYSSPSSHTSSSAPSSNVSTQTPNKRKKPSKRPTPHPASSTRY